MRSKVLKALTESIISALRIDWPNIVKLDPRREYFNGIVGLRLGEYRGRYIFLTLTPNESEDSFRCGISWNSEPNYPSEPFSDLRLDAIAHWAHQSACIQLADLSPGSIPYEFELDSAAGKAKEMQRAITARLMNGELVSEDEWIGTLATKCSQEDAIKEARDIAGIISEFISKNINNIEV